MNAAHTVVENLCTVQRGRICVEMNKVKDTERDNARQLVQLSEQKRFA